jgi:hypothetical protein
MPVGALSSRIVADVKCYFCGHVSGQIFGHRNQPLKVSDFVPRQGYSGPEVKPGMRLRCERCNGPVFLEDATNGLPLARRMPRRQEEPRAKRTAA